MDFRVLSPKENDVSSRFYSVTSEYLSCNACEEASIYIYDSQDVEIED